MEKIAKADPDNRSQQRDLSISDQNVGAVLKALGRFDEALQAYGESCCVTREQLGEAPSYNADWQGDLATAYSFLASVQLKRGNTAEALTALRSARDHGAPRRRRAGQCKMDLVFVDTGAPNRRSQVAAAGKELTNVAPWNAFVAAADLTTHGSDADRAASPPRARAGKCRNWRPRPELNWCKRFADRCVTTPPRGPTGALIRPARDRQPKRFGPVSALKIWPFCHSGGACSSTRSGAPSVSYFRNTSHQKIQPAGEPICRSLLSYAKSHERVFQTVPEAGTWGRK